MRASIVRTQGIGKTPFVVVIFFVAFSNGLAAMEHAQLPVQRESHHREREQSRARESMRSKPRKHKASLEQLQEQAETKYLSKRLSRVDALFAELQIKVQKLDNLDVPGPEQHTNLLAFLNGATDQKEIAAMLDKHLRRKLTAKELDVIAHLSKPTLMDAIHALLDTKSIDGKRAHELITECSPMSGKEIMTLIDLGASQTKSRYLVQMRTGAVYGNPVKMNAEFHKLVAAIQEGEGRSSGITAIALLSEPVPSRLERALREYSTSDRDTLSDARVVSELRRHFVFLSRINLPISFRPGTVDFRPNAISTVAPTANAVEYYGVNWGLLRNLNFVLMGNHYFAGSNSSLTNSLMIAPFGATYWGNFTWGAGSVGWWVNYSERYLGIGGSYTTNFANGAFWSNGAPTYLQVGGVISGWDNNLSIGVSLFTAMSATVGAGASISGTITRNHDVYYRGIYPLDGRFAEIRGLHKIEIDDRQGIALQEVLAANFSGGGLPVMVAFRAGEEWTKRRIYRTHKPIKDAQRMLSESNIAGVLFLLGKDIKETKLPTFMEPKKFNVGDEFVETKTGKLSGAFVVGLQAQLPIAATRAGITADLTAEFELAIRRLPENFFEVSIEPKRIYEMGIFGSVLNTIGGGVIHSVSMARKQSFIFDFNNPDGEAAYFNLVNRGVLPTDTRIDVYLEERGPEYLLTDFRAQNRYLEKRGVALNYLEHIEVYGDKARLGFNSRMMAATVDLINIVDRHKRKEKRRLNLRFDGIDRECMYAQSDSLSTNGNVSVKRTTYGSRKGKGQGTSGRMNKDLYITHSRIHTIEEDSFELVNRWQFGSLMVQAKYEDNLITGEQDNRMADEVNRLFGTYIGSFGISNSRQPRTVTIEREFTAADLAALTSHEIFHRVGSVERVAGVPARDLMSLVDRLRDKHPDEQALRVKAFIEGQSGAEGFAAIHSLLGGQIESLRIRSEAGYNATINEARQFIAKFADETSDSKTPKVNLHSFETRKERKNVENYYKISRRLLGDIDMQLRLLENDPYFVDDDSDWVSVFGKDKASDLVAKGVLEDKKSRRLGLTTARETILKERDLQSQLYTEDEINVLYDIAGRKLLTIRETGKSLQMKYQDKVLSSKSKKRNLRRRFKDVRQLTRLINERINYLEKDVVMIEMDKKYVDESSAALIALRAEIAALVDMRKFSPKERKRIRSDVGNTLFYEVASYGKFLSEVERNTAADSKAPLDVSGPLMDKSSSSSSSSSS